MLPFQNIGPVAGCVYINCATAGDATTSIVGALDEVIPAFCRTCFVPVEHERLSSDYPFFMPLEMIVLVLSKLLFHPFPSYRCKMQAAHPPTPDVSGYVQYVAKIIATLLHITCSLRKDTESQQISLPIRTFKINVTE